MPKCLSFVNRPSQVSSRPTAHRRQRCVMGSTPRTTPWRGLGMPTPSHRPDPRHPGPHPAPTPACPCTASEFTHPTDRCRNRSAMVPSLTVLVHLFGTAKAQVEEAGAVHPENLRFTGLCLTSGETRADQILIRRPSGARVASLPVMLALILALSGLAAVLL